jgi:hypothetical protein
LPWILFQLHTGTHTHKPNIMRFEHHQKKFQF